MPPASGTLPTALFVTGPPGSGKTRLLAEVVASFPGRAGGFYTEEVREGGKRLGFDLITLDGERVPLARAGLPSRHRVGKYGVDLEALERVGLPALREALERRDLVVLDEVGKMELLSPSLQEFLWQALGRGKPLLGVIMASPHPVADRVKAHPRVRVLPLSAGGRERVREEARAWLSSWAPPVGVGEGS